MAQSEVHPRGEAIGMLLTELVMAIGGASGDVLSSATCGAKVSTSPDLNECYRLISTVNPNFLF